MEKNKLRKTESQLLIENEELHQRVYELEETLISIRNGEIDAIVVSGVEGEKLYSLTSVETKYRIIIEEMYEGALILDNDGLITYCNTRFAELISEPFEKIVGSYFVNFLQESEKKVFLSLLRSGLNGKSAGELTYHSKNGCSLYFQLTISVLPPEFNNEVCIVFSDVTELREQDLALKQLNTLLEEMVQDRTSDLTETINELGQEVTKRRLVEEALTKSLERFNLANLASFDIIWDWDLKANTLWINENFKSQFGYKAQEIGPGIETRTTRVHPEDRNQAETSLQQALSSGQINWSDQYRFLLKNGSYADVEDRGYIVRDSQGNPARMVGAMRDITDKKNYEKELVKAREKAEESDRLKTAFLANISHEIRTPMNGILGFADLLKSPDLTHAEQNDFIDIIKKSGDRLLNLINDIVDISKIEAGLMELNITESDIHLQTKYIYSFFKHQAESKGLQLLCKNGLSSKEFFIKTDREKLYAILTNLVKNAIKFTDRGSIEFGYNIVETDNYLSLHTDNPETDNAETDNYLSLRFYVKDTGVGIPLNRQKAIFDRFIQSDIADKRAFQGTGLGLTIAKSYVEMLGGKLWVESEEGLGSTFYFTVPYTVMPKVKTNENAGFLFAGKLDLNKKLKILITDDDETSQMLLSIALKEIKKEVLKAGTGFEAIEACQKNPDIDLVMMDIKMPGMDGYEATRQIRKFNSKVVIIAQTAYAFSTDREKSIAAGCNDYLPKPVNYKTLREENNKAFQFIIRKT